MPISSGRSPGSNARSLRGADDEFRLEIVVKLFEIAYELSWKTLRQDLANDGRIVGSPHAVFVAVYDSGWIEDDQVWFDMINDRNVTVHTYRQDEIEAVVSRVPSYLLAMRAVHDLLKRDF